MSQTDNDLLVFGGSGRTGVELLLRARARGMRVAALLRPSRDDAEVAALGCAVLAGDAFDHSDCWRAVETARPAAIVSLLGGVDASGRRVDAIGNINVIDAALRWNPTLRFVLLTSMGCDEQFALMPLVIQQQLGAALLAKSEAERHLRASALRWTILRPGGLSDATGQGRYQLGSGPPAAVTAYTARQDVALAVLDALADHSTERQALTVTAAA